MVPVGRDPLRGFDEVSGPGTGTNIPNREKSDDGDAQF
jgi:hypothetical protein